MAEEKVEENMAKNDIYPDYDSMQFKRLKRIMDDLNLSHIRYLNLSHIRYKHWELRR